MYSGTRQVSSLASPHCQRAAQRMLRLASRGLRLHGAAAFSTGRPQPPKQKTVAEGIAEGKAERESEYPIMLVNPRTSMGDAAPVFMIAALYFLYCVGADVFEAIFPTPLPMLPREEDDAADQMKVLPDGRVLMKDGSIRRPCVDAADR